MFIAATLCWAQHRNPAKVRNMSATGALLEAPVIPPTGTRVHLIRGSFSAEGRVVWAAGNRCGLHLTTRVEVREWLAPPANKEQQRVDQVVSLVKAGAVPISAGPSIGRTACPELASNHVFIGDLGLVARLIEDLGEDLASEPATLMRHASKLQNLDIAMQLLSALSSELASQPGNEGFSATRTRDLRTSGLQAITK
jgi:hypothetical protein